MREHTYQKFEGPLNNDCNHLTSAQLSLKPRDRRAWMITYMYIMPDSRPEFLDTSPATIFCQPSV